MTECSTCIETYNNSTKKLTNCSKCQFKCCVRCVKLHLLGSNQLPHCMNCKIEWSDDYLRDIVSISWLTKEYSNKRKDLLFEVEKALLPLTMEHAQKFLIDKQFNTETQTLNCLCNKFTCHISNIIYHANRAELNKSINLIEDFKLLISEFKYFNTNTKEEIDEFETKLNLKISDPKSVIRKQFIKSCPENTCKGYLTTKYNCALCKCKVCSKCFEIITIDEHTCKLENILSADLIRKETKDCPKCGINIFKISGCDQMWCTGCNTGFNWSTGKIIDNTSIHNPHFFQWQAINQRSIINHVNTCIWPDRFIIHNINFGILNKYAYIFINPKCTILQYIRNIVISVTHINQVDRIDQPVLEYFDINLKYRIDYMVNIIPLEKFKSLCLTNILHREFNNCINMLFDMLHITVHDIVNNIQADSVMTDICLQLFNLFEYYNKQIINIYYKYKRTGKFPTIMPDVGRAEYSTIQTLEPHYKILVVKKR